ncbi:MAG: hypothetical protein K2L51_06560, partial [Clostridiales bacterium]|nr:hypothetical protein [Clostridiales bacterium]
YAVPQALQQSLYWIYNTAGFPALVEVRDDTYTVSSLFFEDNTAIVPYWVALMNLCAAPDAIRDILIYSYIERA